MCNFCGSQSQPFCSGNSPYAFDVASEVLKCPDCGKAWWSEHPDIYSFPEYCPVCRGDKGYDECFIMHNACCVRTQIVTGVRGPTCYASLKIKEVKRDAEVDIQVTRRSKGMGDLSI